jgi:hypothetical protein
VTQQEHLIGASEHHHRCHHHRAARRRERLAGLQRQPRTRNTRPTSRATVFVAPRVGHCRTTMRTSTVCESLTRLHRSRSVVSGRAS